HLVEEPASKSNSKTNSRRRRAVQERGKKLLEKGQTDCEQSERATYICLYDWLSNFSKPELKRRAAQMKDNAQSVLNSMSDAERKSFDDKFLAGVRTYLDKLSSQWTALETGEFLTVEWSPQK
ncbi:MAG TPA: hypothetical protein VF721_09345, partial [Pyrinomonadaceae bacterium]